MTLLIMLTHIMEDHDSVAIPAWPDRPDNGALVTSHWLYFVSATDDDCSMPWNRGTAGADIAGADTVVQYAEDVDDIEENDDVGEWLQATGLEPLAPMLLLCFTQKKQRRKQRQAKRTKQ
jgi:hypothetical protein